MALIDFDPTAEEQTLNIIKSGVRGSLSQTKSSIEHAMSIVGENPFGLTPQEVFDVLGTQGLTLVNILMTLRTAFNSVAPSAHDIGALIPDGKTVSFDGEGNGTVGDV